MEKPKRIWKEETNLERKKEGEVWEHGKSGLTKKFSFPFRIKKPVPKEKRWSSIWSGKIKTEEVGYGAGYWVEDQAKLGSWWWSTYYTEFQLKHTEELGDQASIKELKIIKQTPGVGDQGWSWGVGDGGADALTYRVVWDGGDDVGGSGTGVCSSSLRLLQRDQSIDCRLKQLGRTHTHHNVSILCHSVSHKAVQFADRLLQIRIHKQEGVVFVCEIAHALPCWDASGCLWSKSKPIRLEHCGIATAAQHKQQSPH